MSQLTSAALQLRLAMSAAEVESTLVFFRLLKVVQLKELCKSIGLALKGKKQDLLDRLEQYTRSCFAAGENIRLLAIRTVVLKMLNNDPIPDFQNLCHALQTGLIDFGLINSQNNRLLLLPHMLIARARTLALPQAVSAPKPQPVLLHSAYYPKYVGPMLLFPSTIFYTLRRMIHGFPYMMVASKGRNVSNVPVHLSHEEVGLLQLSPTTKLYLFSGLSSTPDPSKTHIQFPPIEIHVDGINTKQYVKGLKGKPGTCRPADLSPYIRDLNRQFTINIVYSDAAEPYIVYLYIVDTKDPQMLTDQILTKDHIPSLVTRQAILKEYDLNKDDDIVMATSSISLRCPLTYARMLYPVKSTQCDHIQCFDGLSFLTMQERIPSWICPICSKEIDQLLLAVSSYLQEILKATSEDVDTVTLNPDGSWEAVIEGTGEKTPHSSRENSVEPVAQHQSVTADESMEVILLDSESEDEPDITMVSASELPHARNNGSSDTASIQSEGLVEANVTETPINVSLSSELVEQLNQELSSDDEPIRAYSRRPVVLDDGESPTDLGSHTTPVVTAIPVQADATGQPKDDLSLIPEKRAMDLPDRDADQNVRRKSPCVTETVLYLDRSGETAQTVPSISNMTHSDVQLPPLNAELTNFSDRLSNLHGNGIYGSTSVPQTPLFRDLSIPHISTSISNLSPVTALASPVLPSITQSTLASVPLSSAVLPSIANSFPSSSRLQTASTLSQYRTAVQPTSSNTAISNEVRPAAPKPSISEAPSTKLTTFPFQDVSVIDAIQKQYTRLVSPQVTPADTHYANGFQYVKAVNHTAVTDARTQHTGSGPRLHYFSIPSDTASNAYPYSQSESDSGCNNQHHEREAERESNEDRSSIARTSSMINIMSANGSPLLSSNQGKTIPAAANIIKEHQNQSSARLTGSNLNETIQGHSRANLGSSEGLQSGDFDRQQAMNPRYRQLVSDSAQLISDYNKGLVEGRENIVQDNSTSTEEEELELELAKTQKPPYTGSTATPPVHKSSNGLDKLLDVLQLVKAVQVSYGSNRLTQPDATQQVTEGGATSSEPATGVSSFRAPEAPNAEKISSISTEVSAHPGTAPLSPSSASNPTPSRESSRDPLSDREIRYSKSPFENFRGFRAQNETPNKVKGILGIEISGRLLNTPTPPGERHQSSPAVSYAATQNGSVNSSLSPIDNRIQHMTIETPNGKKRTSSGSSATERTWNKRLSRQGSKKFDPTELTSSQIIELDD